MGLWIAFWLSAVATWAAHSTLWMQEWYYLALSVLAATSLAIGVTILATKERSARNIALVVIGLVIGQWWLIEVLATQVIWRFGGFAP
ncbi:MAG: hypothetical protein AMS22_15085 [Thiotrichales bacterium SG8_50]|jgi:uncharacterized membrane protein YqgA involved in biofilm formation|nr:MAG: hypothetical protein AMS22_15085 [Thiotrichales bacterium SG8_50]